MYATNNSFYCTKTNSHLNEWLGLRRQKILIASFILQHRETSQIFLNKAVFVHNPICLNEYQLLQLIVLQGPFLLQFLFFSVVHDMGEKLNAIYVYEKVWQAHWRLININACYIGGCGAEGWVNPPLVKFPQEKPKLCGQPNFGYPRKSYILPLEFGNRLETRFFIQSCRRDQTFMSATATYNCF